MDTGSPELVSDTAMVNIEVVRNDNAPIFESDTYAASITQNQQVGQRITSVKATDADPTVIKGTTKEM